MKSLSDFISCCGAGEEPQKPPALAAALPSVATDPSPRRKLARLAGSASAGEWEPSLYSISEDKALPVVAGRPEPRKARANVEIRSSGYQSLNGFRRGPIPIAVMAFPPTTILF